MTHRTVCLFGVGCLLIGAAVSTEAAEASEAPIRPADKVVTTEEAPLQVGTATLATIAPGKEMVVTAVNGDWVAVTVRQDTKDISGWIHVKRVAHAPPPAATAPAKPAGTDVTFDYNPSTVKSVKLRQYEDGGCGLLIELSDLGWKQWQGLWAQRPESVAIKAAGRVISRINDPSRSGKPAIPREHVWTGPAMDKNGEYTIGRNKFYGFSKEEAELLIKEISTPTGSKGVGPAVDPFTALCRAYFGDDLKARGNVLDYPGGPGGKVCVAEVSLRSARNGATTYQVLFVKPGTDDWKISNVRPAKTPGDFRGFWPKLEPWKPETKGSDETTKPHVGNDLRGEIPADFVGTWAAREPVPGKFVIDNTSITWERGSAKRLVVPTGKYRIQDRGYKIAFQVEEVAFVDLEARKVQTHWIDVELSLEGKKLKVFFPPTQTREATTSPLVVTSPARSYVYERQ